VNLVYVYELFLWAHDLYPRCPVSPFAGHYYEALAKPEDLRYNKQQATIEGYREMNEF